MPPISSIPRCVLLPALLTATLLAAGPAPAQAATGAYVALGDSYASGVGAGKTSGPCQRSRQAYPHRLGRRLTSLRT